MNFEMKVKVMKFKQSVAAIALILGLVGCQPSFIVSLASGGETIPKVGFLVKDSDHPNSPQYSSLRVLDAEGEIVWRVRTEPSTNDMGVENFSYGDSLDGFATVVEAEELVAGGSYTLIVGGSGNGELHFDIAEDGLAIESEK